MKRIFAAVLALVLTLSGAVVAQASATKTVEIEGVVKITYPASVKLKARGCQNVKISYEIGAMNQYDWVYVGLLDDADEPYGDAIVYETPDFLDPGVSIYKKKSSSLIKICRAPRAENIGGGDYEDYVGAKKGEVQLYVSDGDKNAAFAYIRFR
jgi:hypothetical protein